MDGGGLPIPGRRSNKDTFRLWLKLPYRDLSLVGSFTWTFTCVCSVCLSPAQTRPHRGEHWDGPPDRHVFPSCPQIRLCSVRPGRKLKPRTLWTRLTRHQLPREARCSAVAPPARLHAAGVHGPSLCRGGYAVGSGRAHLEEPAAGGAAVAVRGEHWDRLRCWMGRARGGFVAVTL